jgi:hypothetical protein
MVSALRSGAFPHPDRRAGDPKKKLTDILEILIHRCYIIVFGSEIRFLGFGFYVIFTMQLGGEEYGTKMDDRVGCFCLCSVFSGPDFLCQEAGEG